jgi:FkbM family methyltransferase
VLGLVGLPSGIKFLLEVLGYGVYKDWSSTDVDLLLDVGANVGGVTIQRCLQDPSLSSIALEPKPETAALLRHNLQLNGVEDRVQVLEVAAGSVDADLDMALPIGSSMGVVYSEDATDLSGEQVQVKGVQLDSIPGLVGKRLAVKIDVEGHERHVLRGASKVLACSNSVVVEIHAEHLLEECKQHLERAGLEVHLVGNLLFGTRRASESGPDPAAHKENRTGLPFQA